MISVYTLNKSNRKMCLVVNFIGSPLIANQNFMPWLYLHSSDVTIFLRSSPAMPNE